MVTRIWVGLATVVALVAGLVAFSPPGTATALSPGLAFSADDLPTWQTNGVVRGMAASKGRVVVVGDFTQLRPGAGQSGSAITVNGLAILDAATGQPTTCQLPLSGGTARAYAAEVSPDGDTVFVGGNFGTIGGVNRTRVAEIDVADCSVRSFNVGSVSSFVYSLAVTDDAVYLGGLFQSVAGQPRQSFAKVSRSGALDMGWVADAMGDMLVRPQPGVECRTVVDGTTQGRAIEVSPDGSRVVLGGSFYTINGSNTHSIAVVDAGTGAVVRAYPSNPSSWGASGNFIHPCSFTKAIVSDGARFYIGNEGSGAGVFDGTAGISWSSLNQEWRDTCLGAVQAIVLKNDHLYQAHHHHDCASTGMYPDGRRIYLSTTNVNDTSQRQIGWLPTLNDGTGEGIGGRAMTVATAGGRDYLWVGGEFTRVNGVLQQGLTRFGPTDTGAPPTPNISVRAVTAGALQIAARSVVDPDDGPLQYILYRNNVQIGQPVTVESLWWTRPQVTFVDDAVTPGVSYSYRVRAVDAAGNQSALSGAVNGVASATGSAYAAEVIGDEPEFYWRYDDAGNYVADRSGRNGSKGGLAQGGLSTAGGAIPGDSSGAASFDGSTQYIWNDQIAYGPTRYSVETWFKTSSTTGGVLAGYGNGRPRSDTGTDVMSGSYDRLIYMESTTGRIRFGVYDGALRSLRSDRAYNDDTWHHVVGTQGPEGMRLYIDGVEIGRNSVVNAQRYFGSWRVGADNLNSWPDNGGNNNTAGRFFDGLLDETAVYPRPLSQTEVISHYRAAGGQVEVNDAPEDAYGAEVYGDTPLMYWRFDEASGVTAEDSSFLGTRRGTLGAGVERVTENLLIEGGAVRTPGTNTNGSGLVASASTSAPGAHSLEFWVNTTTTSGGKIIGFENSATASGSAYDKHVYMLNNGRLRFGVYTGSQQTVASTSAVNDGRWHHVVATQDSSGMKLFVDGNLEAQNGVTTNETGDGFWRIGGGSLNNWPERPSSDYFAGQLDEVAVFPTALSADRVQAHHLVGRQDETAPTAPADLMQNGTGASLTWSTSTDANGVAGYRIHRGASADFTATDATVVSEVTGTTWTDDDQTPGTRYYRVTAFDAVGNESAATAAVEVVVADTTAPSTVTGLVASVAGADVLLTWNAASDAVGVDRYLVYRGSTADFSLDGIEPIAQTGNVEYTDLGVAEGQWYYRVVAVDAAGNRSVPTPTAGALVDIDTDAPSVPSDVTAFIEAGRVSVSWSAATDDVGVAGYRVYRGATADFSVGEDTLVQTVAEGTSWQDPSTAVGARHYRVVAFDAAGNAGAPSDVVSVTLADETAPSVPTQVSATAQPDGALVRWAASTDDVAVAGYLIHRGDADGFTPTAGTLVGEADGVEFADEPGPGTHFYRVLARDTAGNTSAPSAAASVTVTVADTTAPTTPGGFTANLVGDDVQVAWTASTDAAGVTGYAVHRGTAAGFTPSAANRIGTTETLGYTDADRPAGTWHYLVIALDAAGNASAPAATSVEILPPAQPVEVVVDITDDAMVAQTAPTRAYGAENQLSSRLTSSTTESFMRIALPQAPAGTRLTGAILRVRTSTDPTATSAESHQFHLVSGSWTEAAVTWNNRPTTVVSGLLGNLSSAPALNTSYTAALDASALSGALGTSVTMRMTGTGGDNVRLWSAEAGTTSARPSLVLQFTPTAGGGPAPDTQAPAAPGGLQASASGSTVNLSWAASTDNVGVTGYAVHRGAAADFAISQATQIGTATGTTFVDAGLPAGTHHYRVVARDAAGNVSAPSASASATVAPPAANPVEQALTPTADTMVASSNAAVSYGANNQLSSRALNGTLQSFLTFALPPAPAGMQLSGAVLRVRTSQDPTAASADSHDIHIMNGTWSEATMVWNNRLTSTASGVIGTLGPAPALNTQYTAAIDPAALRSRGGSSVTLRLSAAAGSDNVRLHSREVTPASYRPTLILTYTAQ